MGGRPEWAGIPGTAYYNEIDPVAAQWLRNLIKAGHIAPGVVDERSIVDVIPEELNGFVQCHFFAGVGVWSYALRLARWPDNRRIWTASCPCQPFSAAGKGDGFADERYLWPYFHHLVRECRPPEILGEQVASSAVDPWIDLVHADLEALGYAFGSVPFPSAGVGAPHIRDRNYWVAHSDSKQHDGRRASGKGRRLEHSDGSATCGLGHAGGKGLDQRERIAGVPGVQAGACAGQAAVGAGIHLGGLGHPDSAEFKAREFQPIGAGARSDGATQPGVFGGPGPTNGFWRNADWLGCRDGKWRPVEPGSFPLAHGATNRVGRLRAYGNAINAVQAQIWIEANM